MAWVARSPFEAQDLRFLISFRLFSLCRLSPQPRSGGGHGTLSIHNTGTALLGVLVCCFVQHFQLNTSPPRGAEASVTFPLHAYVSLCHLPPRHAGRPSGGR